MKDLLGLEGFSANQILRFLDAAEELSALRSSPPQLLSGRFAALLFAEPSTRTLSSFWMAVQALGGQALPLALQGSSVLKGETLLDTCRNLQAVGFDLLIIRQGTAGALGPVAEALEASVVNAGDGQGEHPTQALLDLFTLRRHKGAVGPTPLEGLKVVLLGDIHHSRVARSNAWGLKALGARAVFCGPPDLVPRELARLGAEVTWDIAEALQDADAVNVLRLQRERHLENLAPSPRDYFAAYGLTRERLALAKPDCIVLHPGPLNREVEIASEVADGPRSVILEQVSNGVAVRMAVLSRLSQRHELAVS